MVFEREVLFFHSLGVNSIMLKLGDCHLLRAGEEFLAIPIPISELRKKNKNQLETEILYLSFFKKQTTTTTKKKQLISS